MRAIVYSKTGGPDVLQLVERPVREPEAGEGRVRVQVSGVNPTDWKARRGAHEGEELPFPEIVPNQDGEGRSTPSERASPPTVSASVSGSGRQPGSARREQRRSLSSFLRVRPRACRTGSRSTSAPASEFPR